MPRIARPDSFALPGWRIAGAILAGYSRRQISLGSPQPNINDAGANVAARLNRA
jgi:hypothetical protein